MCLLRCACAWRYDCYNQWLGKSIKTWPNIIQHNRTSCYATLGPAKRWISIIQKRAATRYLFGRAWCSVKSNNVAINHLFTRMFEINRYIHPNDRLNLTNAPIGPIRMDHKITKAEIKQVDTLWVFSQKSTQNNYCFPAMIRWSLASPFDAKNPRNITLNCGYQKGKRVRE